MARTPLMQRLLTLTKMAHQSNQKNIPAKEYTEQNFYNRRNFLSASAKAAAAVTVLAGCSKIAEQPARINSFSEDDAKSTDYGTENTWDNSQPQHCKDGGLKLTEWFGQHFHLQKQVTAHGVLVSTQRLQAAKLKLLVIYILQANIRLTITRAI